MKAGYRAVRRTCSFWVNCDAVTSFDERLELWHQGVCAFRDGIELSVANDVTIEGIVPNPVFREADEFGSMDEHRH